MKTTIKYCLSLGTGIFVGTLTGLLTASVGSGKQSSKVVFLKIFDDAATAVELQAGKQADVLARLSSQLPDQVVLAAKLDRNSPWCTNALWMIRAYYQVGGSPAPASVATTLDKLPAEPPPICRNRLRQVFGNQIPNIY